MSNDDLGVFATRDFAEGEIIFAIDDSRIVDDDHPLRPDVDALIDSVIAANPDQLANYRSGKEALLGFFVGQVIKASKSRDGHP
ncbi:MAG TPA: hypothetical protein VFP64_15925 [Pyrinomonadaceae bacterium]|nr:hypothetical protein [Pyrinomonadaceae bacterium]